MLNKIIFILYFVKVFFYEKNHFICYCFLSKLIISLYIDNIHTIFSCFKSYRRKVFAGGIPIFFLNIVMLSTINIMIYTWFDPIFTLAILITYLGNL